ncbi:PI-PLC X domain-containing protein 2 isoform 2-T2 [Anableps anableps]
MRTRPAGIGNINADWMGSLPSILSAMPLKYLAVPGSHDSFTFWVDVHAPVGPDQKAYVKYLATMFSVLAKKVMVKWSMTQNLTFREQLDAGIRYFDLRVSSKPGESGNEIYFIHGLFGHKEVFGSKMCSDCAVENITLNYLWEKKYQVIVFYHHPSAQGIPVMWPGNKIPAPWANTTEPNKLIQFLETTLKERNKQGSFHVTQAILTPTANTVAKGLVWGLREYLVERNLPIIMSWVQTQRPGVDGINIITSDFVELTDFANIVIKLNNLLLSEPECKPR